MIILILKKRKINSSSCKKSSLRSLLVDYCFIKCLISFFDWFMLMRRWWFLQKFGQELGWFWQKLIVMNKSSLWWKLIVRKVDCNKSQLKQMLIVMKGDCVESWLWWKLILTKVDCDESWLWERLIVIKVNCDESWSWRTLIVTKIDCDKSWSWR